jgi:hypothetical protein
MITQAQLLELLTPGVIGGLTAGMVVVLIFVFILCLLFFIGAYIYYCLVWYHLSKKLKYKTAWLAWIPIANLFLMPILAKKHWALGFLLLIPIVNIVFSIIWCWDIYKKRKFSGALSLVKAGYVVIPLIPFVFIADFIIMGIIAFEK